MNIIAQNLAAKNSIEDLLQMQVEIASSIVDEATGAEALPHLETVAEAIAINRANLEALLSTRTILREV